MFTVKLSTTAVKDVKKCIGILARVEVVVGVDGARLEVEGEEEEVVVVVVVVADHLAEEEQVVFTTACRGVVRGNGHKLDKNMLN